MSPVRAIALALGPDKDAPPYRGFLICAAPGLILGALGWLLRVVDDNLEDW